VTAKKLFLYKAIARPEGRGGIGNKREYREREEKRKIQNRMGKNEGGVRGIGIGL